MYKVDEKQIEIKMIPKGNKGEYIKISRIIPNDRNRQEAVDIRKMYTAIDTNDGEVIKPTTQGIRLTSELLSEVLALVYMNLTEEEKMDFEAECDRIRVLEETEESYDEDNTEDNDEDGLDKEIEM